MGYLPLRNFITSDHETFVIIFQCSHDLRKDSAQLVYYFVGEIESNRLLLFNYSQDILLLLAIVLLFHGAALFSVCALFVLKGRGGGGENAGAYMGVIGSPTGLQKKFRSPITSKNQLTIKG